MKSRSDARRRLLRGSPFRFSAVSLSGAHEAPHITTHLKAAAALGSLLLIWRMRTLRHEVRQTAAREAPTSARNSFASVSKGKSCMSPVALFLQCVPGSPDLLMPAHCHVLRVPNHPWHSKLAKSYRLQGQSRNMPSSGYLSLCEDMSRQLRRPAPNHTNSAQAALKWPRASVCCCCSLRCSLLRFGVPRTRA